MNNLAWSWDAVSTRRRSALYSEPTRTAEFEFWVKYPFAWAGVYYLQGGWYELKLGLGPAPSLAVALLPFSGPDRAALEDAVEIYSQDFHVHRPGEVLRPGRRLVRLTLREDASRFPIHIEERGVYALFAEHPIADFQGAILRSEHEVGPVRTHDYEFDPRDESTTKDVNNVSPAARCHQAPPER